MDVRIVVRRGLYHVVAADNFSQLPGFEAGYSTREIAEQEALRAGHRLAERTNRIGPVDTSPP